MSETSTPTAEAESHWGAEAVDPNGPNLPALKARFLIDHVPHTGKVAEIGSGDGKLLRTLARHRPGLTLFGCDVRAPQTKPDAYTFAKIEGGRLPFEDGALDAVLVFDVLEHVPDPDAMLREAARVVRAGGNLVAFIPVEGETLSFYEVYRRLLGRDTYAVTKEHVQAFTHRGLRDLFERYFRIAEVRYAYHPLGQLMDASFFAAARLKFVRNFWWNDNRYYNASNTNKKSSMASAVLNRLLEAGNWAAYVESTWLDDVRVGSAGVLLDARLK